MVKPKKCDHCGQPLDKVHVTVNYELNFNTKTGKYETASHKTESTDCPYCNNDVDNLALELQ